VAQRTHEIGVRRALGAQKSDVLALILRQAGIQVGGGLALGLGGSVALARFVEGQLFGLAATDTLTYATGAFLVTGVAALAAYLPARRAARVDPMTALRYE
jgi:ABC-type antimicrobial peptide transport system permease subunit